ncbi:hypothetical protein ACF0H5_011023 [Mactra antiquata]
MDEEDPSIMCFPEELHIELLRKVDGKTLAVCKRVCKLWHGLISKLEERKIWLYKCLLEIPWYIFQELTGLTVDKKLLYFELCSHSPLPWQFWREIYAEYKRFDYITNGIEKRTELYFPFEHGEITCLYIHNPDDVIYSGHDSGNVISWSDINEDKKFRVLYKHYKRVTCIGGLNMVTSLDDLHSCNYGNKIISSSRDSNVILYNIKNRKYQTIRHYNKQVNSLSAWGDHFICGADKSSIQGHPLWRSSNHDDIDINETCILYNQSSDITAVAFWDNVILSGNDVGDLYIWSHDLQSSIKGRQLMTHVASLESCIKSIYVLGTRVICFTADGQLCISRHKETFEFQKYDFYKKLLKSPECISVRGSILAIGCRSGSVFLYHIEKDEDWDHLYDIKPRVVKTSHDHVHSIVIGGNTTGPYVAIATNEYCLTIVQYCKYPKKGLNMTC